MKPVKKKPEKPTRVDTLPNVMMAKHRTGEETEHNFTSTKTHGLTSSKVSEPIGTSNDQAKDVTESQMMSPGGMVLPISPHLPLGAVRSPISSVL